MASIAMSALVFAGSVQMAAIELWNDPFAITAILLIVLAINARHMVMGVTLGAKLLGTGLRARLLAFAVLSDVNWAATASSPLRGRSALMHLGGGGSLLWGAWLCGTIVGALAGMSPDMVQTVGFDALMPSFFVCLLAGQARRSAPISRLPLGRIWVGCAALLAGGSVSMFKLG